MNCFLLVLFVFLSISSEIFAFMTPANQNTLRPGLHSRRRNIRNGKSLFVSSMQRLLLTRIFCTKSDGHSEVPAKVPSTPSNPMFSDLSLLEICVGKIVSIKKHPEADSLYVEDIDIGPEVPHVTVASGLATYVTMNELANSLVVIVCNLKPRMMKNILSSGLLLCVSNNDHSQVSPLQPPSECIPGEKITFEGLVSENMPPSNKINKAFSRVQPKFRVDENGIARFEDLMFMTSCGPVKGKFKGNVA